MAFLPPHPIPRKRPKPVTTSKTAPTSLLRLANKTILVTGATGPTGRLICAALSGRGANVRAMIRPKTYLNDRHRVNAVRETCPSVEYVMADLRDLPSLKSAIHGCHGVVSCSGTRNFEGADPNRPEIVDYLGIRQMANCFVEAQLEQELALMILGDVESPFTRGAAVAEEVMDASRFVLVSSLGVTRPERFPQLEAMGNLLRYKLCGEEALRESGCPFTIVRPGGFVDAPAGEMGIVVDQGDRVAGSISRADVAEICAEAIFRPSATNVTFECVGNLAANVSKKRRFEPSTFDSLSRDNVQVAWTIPVGQVMSAINHLRF